MKCKKFLILFFVLALFSGCAHYTLKPAEGVHYAARSPQCNFDIIMSIKSEESDNVGLLKKPHEVIGNIYPYEWSIWPWPPSLDYDDPDDELHEAICKTGADAIEIYGGIGTPGFRHARIRLLKWK